jgi:hypothetical protein
MSKIDGKALKAAIKVLNDSGLLEEAKLTKIKVVGVKMETLLESFGDLVDGIADALPEAKIDPTVIAFYNASFGDGAETADADEDKAPEVEGAETGNVEDLEKEKATEKPAKEKKEKKEKKESVAKPRSCYGHIASAKSGKLDEMLCEGATLGELIEEVDVKLHRVKGHISVLKKKGLTILTKEDEKDPLKTHVQVKEDSI